jgi:putative nucleotidyltransferase with HDIG domain
MQRFGMLPNIRKHSLLVYQVALTIDSLLISNGSRLNHHLIEAGALLHDITKTRALKTGENHSETGAQLLEQLGFSEVAIVVGQHVNLTPQENVSFSLTEAKVVNYSDKRVMHDQIVNLDERFEDIRARYGTTPEKIQRIRQTEKQARDLERKILSHLSIPQAYLERLIHEKT